MENSNKTPDKTWQEPQTNHSNSSFYAIFRVGTRMKDMLQIIQFQKHMQREIPVINADTSIKNEILIGNSNVLEDAKEYLKDVKLRKDNVLATELLLTSSHGFFKQDKAKVDQWVTLNKEWLQYEFKSNCTYAICHKDEYSVHIHALVIPKFENKKGEKILANKRYFGGKRTILNDWQDRYYNAMKDLGLQRGIKGSKAKHLDIKKFYSLINENYNELSKEQLIAKAKQAELLKMQNKALTKTLESYKKQLLAEKNKGLVKDVKQEKKLIKDKVLERSR